MLGTIDEALATLFCLFPKNTRLDQVILKAAALNQLYSTNIYAVAEMARHIVGRGVDPLLEIGSPGAVDVIAKVTFGGKPWRFYSFATKYCSFHNPERYPIYDRFIDQALRHYRKVDHFAVFSNADLREYERLINIIASFRRFYGLEGFTFKAIDKFLWLEGGA